MAPPMPLLALLLCLLAAPASAQKPSTAGFISIDCGLEDVSTYTDKYNGLVYSSDELYTSTGVNMKVSAETNLTGIRDYYATLRSFPDGVRNCYTLAPLLPGTKYRVTAQFFYGSYDGLRRPPTFDLYLGVNLWQTIEAGEFARSEIVAVANSDSIQVCLVNTGRGVPFISALDLRPLPFAIYSLVNSSDYSIVFDTDRRNYGTLDQISFPEDIYDRGWYSRSLGKSIATTSSVKLLDSVEFLVPPAVLQTASVAESLAQSIDVTTPGSAEEATFVYMYFAELEKLAENETREFKVYIDDVAISSHFRPSFLTEGGLYTQPPGKPGGSTFSIRATSNSTLPPIINAVEIFRLQKMPSLPTVERDAKAISEVKKKLRPTRNWEGDPCVPREFSWKGLVCGYNGSNYPQIISLDLSRSGLNGSIPLSITNLTSLTSLDLSYNSLTGEIPDYLGELPALEFLNLEGNNLNGTIPKTIYEKSKNGSLLLRISNNPINCSTVDVCSAMPTKKKKAILPIALGASVAVLLLLAVIITVLVLKRKMTLKPKTNNQEAKTSREHGGSNPQFVNKGREVHSDSHKFSESDITAITNNFKRPIGKGGFGTVYQGQLNDGTQVAVKVLSKSAVHGERQFRAEAELLTRVHHRYLVSLLGYCNENMALVYEFVPLGSLQDHLSGLSVNRNMLSWSLRLRIALEAAQGLDYLHYGCRPPIVHRDVKTSNILLTENFEVKLADFGLSRSFADEGNPYISTVIAGTPGYLDPEYQQTNRLSEKSDVYSFGVVLLELITGKPPISSGKNATHVTKDVRTKMVRGDVAAIADPRMQGLYDVNSMWRVIEIAMSCASMNSKERPTISDVASQLRDCLAVESSREFLSDMSSGTFAMYPDYSMTTSSPAAR